jgi:hypothetical protein
MSDSAIGKAIIKWGAGIARTPPHRALTLPLSPDFRARAPSVALPAIAVAKKRDGLVAVFLRLLDVPAPVVFIFPLFWICPQDRIEAVEQCL